MEQLSKRDRILVYSHVPLWSVHHAETIEIVQDLVNRGNDVYLLSCLGALATCPANPAKDKYICKLCSQQTEYSKASLLPSEVKHIVLDLSCELGEIEIPTNFEKFRGFEYKGVPIGKMVLSQLIDLSQDIFVEDAVLEKQGKKEVISAIKLYEKALEIIREESIDAVYVWNGRRGCDGPVLHAGMSEGIKIFSHISGSVPEKYAVIPNGGIHSTKIRLKLMEEYFEKNYNEELSEKYLKDGEDFFYRQRYTGQSDLAAKWFGGNFEWNGTDYFHSKKKKLVIFTSSYWEWIATTDVELPDDFLDPYNLLVNLIHDRDVLEKYEVIIRWHPNLVNAGKYEQRRMKEILSSNVSVLQFEPGSSVDSYQLLFQSDLVVTFGSTLGIEATYYGKASIVAGPNGYTGLNAVYEPRDFIELKTLLLSEIKPKPVLNAIKYGSWNVNFGESYQYVKYDENSKSYKLNDIPIKHSSKKGLRLQIQRVNFHLKRSLR